MRLGVCRWRTDAGGNRFNNWLEGKVANEARCEKCGKWYSGYCGRCNRNDWRYGLYEKGPDREHPARVAAEAESRVFWDGAAKFSAWTVALAALAILVILYLAIPGPIWLVYWFPVASVIFIAFIVLFTRTFVMN